MTNHTKKGKWLGSRDPFLHVKLWDLEKVCHGMPITEISNAIDAGPLFLTPMVVDASIQGTSSIVLISCCKLACIIRRQQIDQVGFGTYRVCMYYYLTVDGLCSNVL